MHRTANLIYCAAFCGTLLGLALWSSKSFTDFSVASDTPVLNGKLSHAFEKHYDDEFPVRQFGTNVWAALEYSLFGEGRPGVVIGENDWLYSDEEFKPVADGEQHLRDNLAIIRGVREQLQRHDVQLVLAIIPAKSRLYPEHTGQHQPAALRSDLYQQLRSTARRANIVTPDLLAALQQAKQHGQVFLRNDTHWTPLGAEVAAQQVGAAVHRSLSLQGEPQRYITEITGQKDYKGDLTRFLPLDPLFENLLPPPERLQLRETRSTSSADLESGDALFAEQHIPVALVGTSYSANPNWNFAGALRQSLGHDVSNHAEDGNGPILPMLRFLQSDALKDAAPQLVIWEFPERYLPMGNDLSDFDPDWIAELKQGTGNQRLARH